MRNITLFNPISSLDLESTGTDVEKDRICSIAITRITTDLKLQSMYTLVNPGIPIPPGATAIHGITDEMVKDAPFLNMITDEIIGALEGTDILTFNGLKFDMPMLNNEFNRIGYPWDYTRYNHIDAYRIFQKDNPRKLADAHRIYCGEPLNDAHNAKADTEGTAKVFLKQLENPAYPLDMAALQLLLNDNKPMADLSGKFYFNEEGQPCIKFGKHKGKTFDQVKIDDASYFTWILEGNFPTDSKNFLKSILK